MSLVKRVRVLLAVYCVSINLLLRCLRAPLFVCEYACGEYARGRLRLVNTLVVAVLA